jgi:hypothetical protein
MSRDNVNPKHADLRRPTEAEKALIDALLGAEFPGNEALRKQLEAALVKTLDEDGGLEISPPLGSLPAVVKRRIPDEAETDDIDGVPIHLLLHVVDGFARELELFREDGKTVRRQPRPESLRLLVL